MLLLLLLLHKCTSEARWLYSVKQYKVHFVIFYTVWIIAKVQIRKGVNGVVIILCLKQIIKHGFGLQIWKKLQKQKQNKTKPCYYLVSLYFSSMHIPDSFLCTIDIVSRVSRVRLGFKHFIWCGSSLLQLYCCGKNERTAVTPLWDWNIFLW